MEQFLKYIDNTSELLKDPNKILLEEITKDYPYFQSAHLLLVIARHQTDGIFFSDRDLKNAAIYAGDRAKLYHYLVEKDSQAFKEHITEKKPVADSTESEKDEIKIEERSEKKAERKGNSIKRKQSDDLIDKFLKDKPTIQPPKEEFYSATKMAMQSLSEDESMVSETLAQIHVRSKRYEKAIEIYQKLSLHYPEKSNYFAEIINGLKSKLNN